MDHNVLKLSSGVRTMNKFNLFQVKFIKHYLNKRLGKQCRGKKPLGRLRYRWKDTTKEDLTKAAYGTVGWIQEKQHGV
jgi:hypothetical protein